MCLLVQNNQIRRCRPCVKHSKTRLCSSTGNWVPVIIFRTVSGITTGCLQPDEYLMNHFNDNYMVRVIHEKTLSWWASKEVKMLVNAELSSYWRVAGKQMQLYYTSKCCKFNLRLKVCSISGVGNIYDIKKKFLKSVEGLMWGQW